MWFLNTLHFGICGGGEEHQSFCWGDIELKHDASPIHDYLDLNERQTKTCTDDDLRNVRDSKPPMYDTPNIIQHFPFELFKAYHFKRPAKFCFWCQ